MPYEEFRTENYRFMNFSQVGSNVTFEVEPIEGRDVAGDDETRINEFLNHLGKWESVAKAGFYLLSGLGLRQIEESTLQNYEKELGIEKYTVRIERTRFNRALSVIMRLSREERHRREATEEHSILQIQEIYDQLKNIPKWKALEKAMNLTLRDLI